MISATGVVRTEGFPYALDNGAWTAYQQGKPFDAVAFEKAVEKVGDGADFVVIPDIVGEGLRSLDFSMEWAGRLDGVGKRRLLAVQDGMEPSDVAGIIGADVGLFVGGTTEWKKATMAAWSKLAREVGAYCHVGRVNTIRRINLCLAAGVDSFDGTSASKFAKTLPMLDKARRQTSWLV